MIVRSTVITFPADSVMEGMLFETEQSTVNRHLQKFWKDNGYLKKTNQEEPQGVSEQELRRRKRVNRLINFILTVAILIGLGLLAYPTFSDWWNHLHQSQAISSYVEKVSSLSVNDNKRMWNEARAYNRELLTREDRYRPTEEETEEYNEILDVTGTGIMGYIVIPKINVSLPIYHGTDEAVLQIAVGHIEGTSLPVGGTGSHTVISGHRGLPSARLFTDINRLVEGDTFQLQVLNYTLTYEVDQIRIVLPDELDDLEIDPEQDYCTLVTCTPYGVNSHRLLVRGHRVENAADELSVTADAMKVDPTIVAPIIGAGIVVLLVLWAILSGLAGKRKKRQIH